MKSIKNLYQEYKDLIIKSFGADFTILLYGSRAYNQMSTSDFDICLITKKDWSKTEIDSVKELTINFHKQKKWNIDEEVPFSQKLIFSENFIKQTLKSLPFPRHQNRYFIPPIIKNKKFLSSTAMKKRLLLNILTTKHIILHKNDINIESYIIESWKSIIKTVLSYSCVNKLDINRMIDLLCTDQYTNASGEMFLGYKEKKHCKNYMQKTLYKLFKNLENEKVVQKKNNYYIFDNVWINN